MSEKLFNAYHQEIELTDEQEACLKYTGNRTLMVKGYAGAGKSVVLMGLAQKLVERYGVDSCKKVGLFTFQQTLVSSTKETLKVNGTTEKGVLVTTVNSYVMSIYDSLVKCGMADKVKYPSAEKKGEIQRINNVKKAIEKHRSKYGKHRFHNIEPQFWVEEFDWMKDMNIWVADRSRYLSLPRKGRGSSVRMSAIDRETAFDLYKCYCDYLKQTKQGDWADQTLYLIRHPELISDKYKFEHILIDEAQDLSLAQMMVLMLFYGRDMTIAMDANQRIFNKHWTPKQLGIETTTKKLTRSMRTTKQIDALAECVRSKNDELLGEDDRSLRAIPIQEGVLPQVIHLDNALAERKYVVTLIKELLGSNPTITIGIIAAKKSQFLTYSEWLSDERIPFEEISRDSTFSVSKPGVKLVSAFGAKGLEFTAVIIPMFAEGYFPYNFITDDEEAYEQFMIKMRNIVYVSMTRARRNLYISFWGNGGSRFINDMDTQLYELVGSKPIIKKHDTISFCSDGLDDAISLAPSECQRNAIVKPNTSEDKSDLVKYLKQNDIEYIDNRKKGGSLWIVGGANLNDIVQETKKEFGTRWTYLEKGGMATKHRPAWYTKSEK